MYESLRPFDRSSDLPLLPGQEEVLPLRNPVALSIAPVEVPLVMERFPIAWRRDAGEWDLVALTGLTPQQDTWKPGPADSGARIVPLLLRAYPLAVLDDGAREALDVMVDEAALYPPGHAAARAFDPSAAEEALNLRLQALWTFTQSRRALKPAFDSLAAAGALVPWALGFRSSRRTISLDGFYVIDAGFLGTAAHRALVRQHGWLAASLVSLHRISQHRINGLLRHLDRADAAA